MLKEAMLYHSMDEQKCVCDLCSHRCELVPDKYGVCGVRQNREGKIVTHVYGEVIAAHVDPIEKKPLYHYLPGSTAFSVATIGCNFKCPFCQNWQISQQSKRREDAGTCESFSPEEIVKAAKSIISNEFPGDNKDEVVFSQTLCTEGITDPDLIIRTGGVLAMNEFHGSVKWALN